MRTKLIFLITFLILMLQTGCLYAVRYDGPYHGKVVDEQTHEPIEGVVVLGWWMVHHFGLGGGYGSYHDAREAVTDKNGEFTIRGEGLRILSSLQPMDFLVYKAGHTYFQSSWDSLKIETRKDMIKWEGETPIVPIRKLTDEERKKSGSFPPTPPMEASLDKVKSMLNEINIETRYRGLEPIKIWRGEKTWGN